MGSNLGDSRQLLMTAIKNLSDVRAVSGVYETAPVGGPIQDAYLNLVVEISTSLEPYELLSVCQELEQEARRVRAVRWGPRTCLLYTSDAADE